MFVPRLKVIPSNHLYASQYFDYNYNMDKALLLAELRPLFIVNAKDDETKWAKH